MSAPVWAYTTPGEKQIGEAVFECFMKKLEKLV